MYDGAARDLKEVVAKKDFVKLMSAINRKLGEVESTEQVGWHIEQSGRVTHYTLTYATTFANGEGVETISFQSRKGDMRLIGYHVNSDALILN